MTPPRFGDRLEFGGGVDLRYGIEGADSAAERLLEIADRGEDMRPAMKLIKQLLIEGHEKQFKTKGAYMGSPWPENSPETLKRKAREGVASLASVMVESGDLQESLSGGKNSSSRVSKSGVKVGTALFYAVFHMAGASGKGSKSGGSTPARHGRIPARPVVGITDSERETALQIMERHVMGRG